MRHPQQGDSLLVSQQRLVNARTAAKNGVLPDSSRGRGGAGRFPSTCTLYLYTSSKRGSGRRTPAATPAAASPINGEKRLGNPPRSPPRRLAAETSAELSQYARRRVQERGTQLRPSPTPRKEKELFLWPPWPSGACTTASLPPSPCRFPVALPGGTPDLLGGFC